MNLTVARGQQSSLVLGRLGAFIAWFLRRRRRWTEEEAEHEWERQKAEHDVERDLEFYYRRSVLG